VILDESDADGVQLTDAQIFAALYESDEDGAR
jgi:hypothetical protein